MKENNTGKVWLVGAGPSDPGLMTIKGMQVLQKAEVVVCDALIGAEILQMIPKNAERIYVGKRAGCHTMPQEEINMLLLRKAQEGKKVVRLKGGDPFLFGRGGEEMETLCGAGIPCEVVPGVTSALAVPAYQGIPVTHRDFCSSLHIVTGHRRNGVSCDIDFDALVRIGGTLVFLMGAAAVGDICSGLLGAGMNANTPAALLMRGTTARQERILATVSTLEEAVRKQGVKTPAIILVGKVCSLAADFSWYDKLPLSGLRILVTRPRKLAEDTAGRLRELGAQALICPTISLQKRKNNTALFEVFRCLSDYRWLVFTSPGGVRIFFEEFYDQKMDIRLLGGLQIAVIGNGTRNALLRYGIHADLMPEVYDGAHLGRLLAAQAHPGDRILIPRAAVGNQELTDALTEMVVDDIPTYDTVYETEALAGYIADLCKGEIDYVFFTSASSVKGFVCAADTVDEAVDITKIKAICIGKQTQSAADALGMQTWAAKTADIESMIECLLRLHK